MAIKDKVFFYTSSPAKGRYPKGGGVSVVQRKPPLLSPPWQEGRMRVLTKYLSTPEIAV